MSENSLVIFHPDNNEQVSALRALAKVLKMNFEITTQEKFEKKIKVSKEKKQLINDIKEAVEELKLVKAGKIKARNVGDLLNDL